jgi:medium-chain acyl-[acyl-carrier-protein] hydrolase
MTACDEAHIEDPTTALALDGGGGWARTLPVAALFEVLMMTSTSAVSPWLVRARPNPNAALRLFCFPYAGGSAQIYRAWPQRLPPSVEVCAVQLPGRGNRLREPPFTDLDTLVRALAEALLPYLDQPFAFFGHSMGALICFELAHRLRERGSPGPIQLFVSGHRAPQLKRDEPTSYDLPEPELLEELRRINGTPREVLEHPELIQLMLPLLRADFKVVQTYLYAPRAPLDTPLTAFGGLRDADVSREQMAGWREQTTAEFSLHMLPGDHFFIQTSEALLLEVLSRRLDQLSRSLR